jgi:diguanylate cyclase (GGDEF)-like protein/PAS domain S-box-containing protein
LYLLPLEHDRNSPQLAAMISKRRQPAAAANEAALSVPAGIPPAFTDNGLPPHIGRRKLRLGRFLMAALSAAMFCVLMLVLRLQGLIESGVLLQTFGLSVIASGVFLLIFLSRLNERATDPSLTGEMMTVAVSVLLYIMYMSSTAREMLPIFIGMILLFGVFRFSGRELLRYAVAFLLAYGAVIALSRRLDPQGAGIAKDFARWLVLATALPLFVWVGGHVSKFRRRMDERKAFYQTIWEACADVVIVVDGNAVIRYVNPAITRVFGHDPAELIGVPLSRLQPPQSAPGEGEDLQAMAQRQRSLARAQTREAVGWHRAGRPLPVEATFTTVVLDGEQMVVGFLRDITERRQSEERIRHMANHDVLTELPNRMLLTDRLNHAIAGAVRHGESVWVAFLDIDRFKLVNDSLGHATGDALLRTVAARLLSVGRDSETVARLGGDEFVLVLPQRSGASLAHGVVRRFLDAVGQPVIVQGHELMLTCSIGIAVFPGDGHDADTLIEHADIAMYRAKERGRNGFCFYTSSMNELALERLRVEGELRSALELGQFVLHYQPQLDLSSGRIVGVEALVRWQHPEKGLLAPAHFINIAEETGLIVPLGNWVLRTACEQNKRWQRAGYATVRTAVNLSARQFAQPGLTESIAAALRESGLDPSELELEITESMVMTDVERTIVTLRDLKSLGVQLSVDDFGTGYSSLAYLKRFPIDVLKIDRSFVRDMTSDAGDAAIVTTVIALAHNLGLTVVAEGVEEPAQLEFLKRHGCDSAQGYLFSKPVPGESLARMLQIRATAAV